MIFDFNHSLADNEAQLVILKKYLQQIAGRSVLDSNSERDRLLDESIHYIREGIFDAVEGGFYWQSGQSIQFNCGQNAILAEYLYLADKVFYHGELAHCAARMMENLLNHSWNDKYGYFVSTDGVEKNVLPFVCSGSLLTSWLSQTENQLLAALLKEPKFEDHKKYCIAYRCALKTAANVTQIEYKQAQILEACLIQKLKSNLADRYQLDEKKLEFNLSENCLMLNTLVQAILWHDTSHYLTFAKRLFSRLLETFTAAKKLSGGELVDLCFTLLNFLQLEFDADLLSVVANRLNKLTNSQVAKLSGTQQSKLAILFELLNYFNSLESTMNMPQCAVRILFELPKEPCQVERVSPGLQGQHYRQQLLSRYTANLFLFSF